MVAVTVVVMVVFMMFIFIILIIIMIFVGWLMVGRKTHLVLFLFCTDATKQQPDQTTVFVGSFSFDVASSQRIFSHGARHSKRTALVHEIENNVQKYSELNRLIKRTMIFM